MTTETQSFSVDEEFSVKCADTLGASISYDPFRKTQKDYTTFEPRPAYEWDPEEEDWDEV